MAGRRIVDEDGMVFTMSAQDDEPKKVEEPVRGFPQDWEHGHIEGFPYMDGKPREPEWFKFKHFPDSTEMFMLEYVRTMTGGNTWYYKDRCGVNRGPAPVPVLREAWSQGLVDETTLVWGQGLIDFVPIKNVRTLVPLIRTPEGELAFADWRLFMPVYLSVCEL